MSKIDTQGMSAPMTPDETKKARNQTYKPAVVTPRRIIEPTLVKELKILINEVLNERNGFRGKSYFDTENFKHYVGEEEPSYKDWK